MDNASPTENLSPKQREVLELIEDALSRTGRPPTYRDLATALGVKAVGTIQDHIKALIKKGFLEVEAGVARSFRLPHHTGAVDIPVLGSVPAGSPREAIADRVGALSVSTRQGGIGLSPKLALSGDLFALKVTGESMIAAGVMDGDFVIVRKQTTAENGDMVVAMINGEVTVKTYEKKSGRVRLLPENPWNPRYQPIEIPAESENVIQGRVVSVQRFI